MGDLRPSPAGSTPATDQEEEKMMVENSETQKAEEEQKAIALRS